MELTTFYILTLLFYETQEIRLIIFFTRDLQSISNYLLHEHWSFSTNDNILVFGTKFLKFSTEPYASIKQLRITMHNAMEYRVGEWRFQWNWCKCDSLYRADGLWADLREREREREKESGANCAQHWFQWKFFRFDERWSSINIRLYDNYYGIRCA